jgi:aldose 1-epimerase
MLDNVKTEPAIESEFYGYHNSDEVYLITLINNGITVKITNFGCSITAINAPDRNGEIDNVVAGFKDIGSYNDNPHYLGCVLGRYAGRITKGRYEYNKETIQLSQNEQQNHLHGGFAGLNRKVWKVKSYIQTDHEAGVIMQYLSEDGEEGYPGNLWIDITYVLNANNQLSITYNGTTDKTTPINLSNHSYFNLSGFKNGQIIQHLLQIDSSFYTEKNEDNLPTGKILNVEGSAVDFRSAKEIGRDIGELVYDMGYDHNFVLNEHLSGEVIKAATLEDPFSGRVLNVYTDQPAIQVYTANFWNKDIPGVHGINYEKHAAVALETQNFPDAPNHLNFPDALLKPNERYSTKTVYEFVTK